MLALSRYLDERLVFHVHTSDGIVAFTVQPIAAQCLNGRTRVKLAVSAPDNGCVYREELLGKEVAK